MYELIYMGQKCNLLSSPEPCPLCGLCVLASCDRVTLLHREVRAAGTCLGIFRLGYSTGRAGFKSFVFPCCTLVAAWHRQGGFWALSMP